jgi:ribosomal subunit interface protein
MALSVKGKQLDVGDALRQHVAANIDSLFSKYFSDPIDAAVTFAREAHLFRAQISVHVGRGIRMESEADADTPYSAYDTAANRIAKRLRRHKRRLRDHHRRDVAIEPAGHYVLAAERADEEAVENESAQPVIIAEMNGEVPTLTVGEAVMRLDLTDEPAMLFRNRSHGGLNMIYRRADGNVGWLDPRGNRSSGANSGRTEE